MPAATAEPPSVSLSFANNFWGKEDAGVGPLLDRMAGAKQTCDELKSFYGARAAIEDEYAKKLLNLTRKPLGHNETGSLKTSLDTLRGEVEAMAKQHQSIAAQMKTELEEPLAAFAGGMKERRKIVQGTVEKLLKTKIQQTQQVNKTRDKYEQECLKIKGYLAQGHMVMGQEERKNKAKLEKTQISLATSNTEYESAVKALEDTTTRWNREWKAAADKFQDLEEERLDFTKSSLWTFANVASTVCVSDDASCEKIRLSLEKMDVEKDIAYFINERGTGQEIPDPPKYINFCRGDINDTQSEASEDENYSVAQFPRSINPAFRSSSPQPSTFESHHDPDSALANNLAHRDSPSHGSREPTLTPQKMMSQAPPRQLADEQQYQRQPPPSQMAYEINQHQQHDMGPVPHDPYPMDGMTMLCRTGPPSDRSAMNSARPSSRDSRSEYSNPTSFSSMEPPSPVKQAAPPAASPEKQALAELKGVGLSKESASRMSADHYHGIATPAPGSESAARAQAGSNSREPPPSYGQPPSRLGVPPPAVTSKAMKQASQKVAEQTRSVFGDRQRGGSSSGYGNSPNSRSSAEVPRAASPAPTRSASPQPPMSDPRRMQHRSASPNPQGGYQSRNGSQASMHRGSDQGFYRGASPNDASSSFGSQYSRSKSAYGQSAGGDMAVQLAPAGDDGYGSQRGRGSQAMGLYEGGSRQRSKSVADPSRQYTRDGRPILHFARALYMYQAAIPEELGFAKGDYLAVLRHQDDGWWEAEDTLQQTARTVTSKPVQRAVVTSFLALIAALSLFFTAAIATALFFQNYVPDQVLTTPVHLQYGSGSNPYGVASLASPAMKPAQEYDISVTLSLPRSPPNLDRGNFMITLYLLDTEISPQLVVDASKFALSSESAAERDWDATNFLRMVLFHARRPALIPFVDPVVAMAKRVLFVGWYILWPENAQTCTLTVPLAERVGGAFAKAPRAAYIEVEGGQTIQIYDLFLTMTAQLSGLRYVMFHYRLLTYSIFTFLFWVSEVFFMGGAYLVFSSTSSSSAHRQKQIDAQRRGEITYEGQRQQSGNVSSDHPHTFPTYGKQPRLKHEPQDTVKTERDEEEEKERLMAELPVAGAEADDEDDDDYDEDMDKRDSGIGTSYSEDQGRGQSIRKRTSRNLK
ncbi:adipose-regulatory protein [Sarocladium implicatum]|nr:adipose-regulatory protein [Sarocladium implicatum]